MKDKKAKAVLHTCIEILNESKRKPTKLWFDHEREFYNKFMHKYLDDNDILMYSVCNESNSVVAERSVKGLKGNIYKK